MTELIFHLADPGHWAARTDVYSPRSVEEEGFVHCSTGSQLAGVAKALYHDRDDLVLLSIDTRLLHEGTLVYEDLYEHGDLFPHVYGPLPIRAVVSSEPYQAHLRE